MRVVVIGGGLVGLASARALLRARPGLDVIVLEKEAEVGQHQSTHNSGVLHAGLHYAPGSAKARLVRRGIRLITEYCREQGIAHDICGKLVAAVDESEIPRLRALHERGTANGLTGLRWLSAEQARELEPHVNCIAALHVPEEGIVDFGGVCRALARELAERVRLNARVHDAQLTGRGHTLFTSAGDFTADYVLNCAGLFVDRVAALFGPRPVARVLPFRGEYYKLRPERQHLVRNLIYPVPNPTFPFLGVHFTRMVAGGVEAGPNAVLATAREGYRLTDFNLRDVADALGFPGFWRFLARYPQQALLELRRSISKDAFVIALRRLVPEISAADLVEGGAGVRAQAVSPAGDILHDFLFMQRQNELHVLNAPSPAATACLAIGELVATRVLQGNGGAAAEE